jgi:tetratricopeptide (TPR) repeat protein
VRETRSHGLEARATTNVLLLVVSASTLLGGCANQQKLEISRAVNEYFSADYAHAAERLRPLAEKTDENFVLNNARLGSAALAEYDLPEAEAAFLRGYEVINSVGVNNGGRSLGAVLVDEKIKVWKGEPFERAMLNFYLGLVYYMQHDYDNARGAFENALFKLRDYGETKNASANEEYRRVESNFALGYLMLGKAFQRLNRPDLARANFDRAVELHASLRELANYDWNENSNVLLVIDYGYGPQKVTNFDGAIVGFGPEPAQVGPITRPTVLVDGKPAAMRDLDIPPVDLLALAQDRRWQSIDTIRTVKSAIGTGLIAAGTYQGLRHNPQYGDAIAMIAAGLLLKATSQADVRQWEMLPRTTFIVPLHVDPGEHDVTVDFRGMNGASQTWRKLPAPSNGQEATYYLRMQRWNTGPYDWPPPALAGAGPPGREPRHFTGAALSPAQPTDESANSEPSSTMSCSGISSVRVSRSRPGWWNSTSYATDGANHVLRTIPTSPRFSDSSGMSWVRRT